jgi:hypothetical protein
MIFGDRYQGIYEFKGANTKFLTLADKLWDCEFTKLNTHINTHIVKLYNK